MNKEELEKEARTECFMLTVNTIGIDQTDVELAYVMGAEPREKQIAELEKENAELKKELKISQRCWQDQKNISLNANCSLYKAKKLIEELSSSLSVVGECGEEECELLNRAEQFLKDSEV